MLFNMYTTLIKEQKNIKENFQGHILVDQTKLKIDGLGFLRFGYAGRRGMKAEKTAQIFMIFCF